MSKFNSFIINSPALEALQKLQNNSAVAAAMKVQTSPAFIAAMKLQESSALATAIKIESSPMFAVAKEIQKSLESTKMPLAETAAALIEYRNMIAPLTDAIKQFNIAYSPILEATKNFEAFGIKSLLAGVQASAPAIEAIKNINFVEFANIIDALPKYNFINEIAVNGFSIEEAEKLFSDGEISQEEVNEEFVDIIEKKKFSPKAEWDKIQKSKWYLAVKLLICIVAFLGQPIIDYVGDKVRDTIGITQFIEEYELYDLIDNIFETDKETVTEEDAKATVDTSKTGNISKQKREDLLDKIKEIRSFISAAPQDENTGNLLSYLSDLEKDVNGKKYGLVFEEHREEIDEVLDTHTPVLTEVEELFIDNGGQMNFLIEGDNLASLKLLEKTHKGKIDLIYIDPPYNTMSTGFTYSDTLVDNGDNYRHSKWSSFMKNRLEIARTLLSPTGCIFISIDDNEFAALKLVCDEVFGWQNFVTSCMWQKYIVSKMMPSIFL